MSTEYIPTMMARNEELINIIKNKKKESMKGKIIYNKDNKILYIADQGEYKGVKYFIVAGGIHPCAYVMCDELFIIKHKNDWGDIDSIYVHGGVTWAEEVTHLKCHPEDWTGFCFGWDYGHVGDYAGYHSEEDNICCDNHKWTFDEILDECHNAIDQYLEVKREDEEEIAQTDHLLTKEILENLGFTNVISTDKDSYHMMGNVDGKKWRIYIDFQSPGLTYARNEASHRKYEGSILTLEELKKVVDLCKLPVEV